MLESINTMNAPVTTASAYPGTQASAATTRTPPGLSSIPDSIAPPGASSTFCHKVRAACARIAHAVAGFFARVCQLLRSCFIRGERSLEMEPLPPLSDPEGAVERARIEPLPAAIPATVGRAMEAAFQDMQGDSIAISMLQEDLSTLSRALRACPQNPIIDEALRLVEKGAGAFDSFTASFAKNGSKGNAPDDGNCLFYSLFELAPMELPADFDFENFLREHLSESIFQRLRLGQVMRDGERLRYAWLKAYPQPLSFYEKALGDHMPKLYAWIKTHVIRLAVARQFQQDHPYGSEQIEDSFLHHPLFPADIPEERKRLAELDPAELVRLRAAYMSQDCVFGDFTELNAAAKLMGRPIVVLQKQNPASPISPTSLHCPRLGGEPLCLFYNGTNHFDPFRLHADVAQGHSDLLNLLSGIQRLLARLETF